MKCLLLLAAATLLIAQRDHPERAATMPVMEVPPVIVLAPAGDKLLAVLLATRDVPVGTNVLPVVTSGLKRSILPGFTVSSPGAYKLAEAPLGSEVMAYVTPPTGNMYRLRSTAMVSGYQYDGELLIIYGRFTGEQVLVYIGTSLVPVRPMRKQGHLELGVKPTGTVTTLTVYQGSGLSDSVPIRLR